MGFCILCQCLYLNKHMCVRVCESGTEKRARACWCPRFTGAPESARTTVLGAVQTDPMPLIAPEEFRAWLYGLVSTALNTVRWKKLQSEKEELERCFEEEVKQLCRRQQEELQVLEQRLQEEYNTKKESLQEQHRLQLEQVQLQHRDQVSLCLFPLKSRPCQYRVGSGNDIYWPLQHEDTGNELMTGKVYSWLSLLLFLPIIAIGISTQ